jgi:uncharacterized protein YraI
MSRRQWALVAALLLVNYIIFASLLTTVLSHRIAILQPTRTPLPTFSPLPSPTPLVVLPTHTLAATPTPIAAPVVPTPTPAVPAAQPSATRAPGGNLAAVTVDVSLNVRAGPGTDYPRVGSLAPGSTVPIVGRNADSSWWQITFEDVPNGKGWISARYGTARNTGNVPIVEAPPVPTAPPAAPTAAAAAERPAFQYSPLAWQGQWNAGLAQIRGHVRDAAGNPVKGAFVQARCGGTVLASNPSGTNLYAPGEGYEAGAYDIILSSPLDPNSMCKWEVRVVDAPNYDVAKDPGASSLSPVGYCDLTLNEMSICFAEWTKNW